MAYEEVLKSAQEEKDLLINVAYRKRISISRNQYCNGALKKTSNDKYILIMNKKELKKLEAENFQY